MRKVILPLLALIPVLLVGCGRDQQVAYLDNGEVFRWEQNTVQAERLTDRDDVVDFVYSPSGRHLAYLVDKPYSDSFWCYTSLDDPGEVKTRSQPLFSAAGSMVAYIKDRENQLILLDEDGGGQIEVAQWVQSAQWNSAGDMLAYIEEGDLKVFALEGMTSRFLASNAVAGPDFVADDVILFVSSDDTLCAAATDGGGVFRLVEESREYHIPRDYSGQVRGKRLICVDIDRDAYLMSFDGSERCRTGTDTYRVVWDHQGERFFLVERDDREFHVNIFHASGDPLLEHREPWDRLAADTLCWSWVDNELAYINERGQLHVMNLDARQRLISEKALAVSWLPYQNALIVLEPIDLEELELVQQGEDAEALEDDETLDTHETPEDAAGEAAEEESDDATETTDDEGTIDDAPSVETPPSEAASSGEGKSLPGEEPPAETVETALEDAVEESAAPPETAATSGEQGDDEDDADTEATAPEGADGATESPDEVPRRSLAEILVDYPLPGEAAHRAAGIKSVELEPPAVAPAPGEIVQVAPETDDEGRPRPTAVYLYNLDEGAERRRLIARSESLPLPSPDGEWLLLAEPLSSGLYNLTVYPTRSEETGEIFLGKLDSPELDAAWRPEGRKAEGAFGRVVLILALIIIGVSVIIFLIRSYLRHTRNEELRRKMHEHRAAEERDAVM
jgi:hypothetical protein